MSFLDDFAGNVTTLDDSVADRMRRLRQGILFSREWTPTYMIVVGMIMLACIAYEWITKIFRSTRRRRLGTSVEEIKDKPLWDRLDDVTSSASSSSSTLEGQQLPADRGDLLDDEDSRLDRDNRNGAITDHNNETTPLISTVVVQRKPVSQAWSSLSAILMYQPAPIRGLTTSFNVLPANSETLTILLLFVPNLFYLLYRCPLDFGSIVVISDRAGLLTVANLPFLYILGAKNHPFRVLMGRSYESLNIYHRRLGEWMVFLATLHSIGLAIVYWEIYTSRGFTLWTFLNHYIIKYGILAILTYIVLYGTSVGSFRERHYEAFLALHIIGQLGGLVFLYLHFRTCKKYVLAAILIWFVDRLLMRILVVPVTANATVSLAEDGETVLLTSKLPVRSRGPKWLKFLTNILDGWQPGQHIFISVPSLSQNARLQAHPYTILSMPDVYQPESEEPAYRSLDLIIRARDGFTRDLLDLLKAQQPDAVGRTILENLPVRIDGPYGSTDALQAAKFADRALFIAGGSGIAVTSPIVTAVSRPDDLHSSSTLSTSTPPFNQLAHCCILRSKAHISWIPSPTTNTFYPTLVPPNGTDSLASTSTLSRAELREKVLDDAVGWVEKHGDLDENKKIVVVVSGPDGMIRGIRNRCAEMVSRGWQIEVWTEKFGW